MNPLVILNIVSMVFASFEMTADILRLLNKQTDKKGTVEVEGVSVEVTYRIVGDRQYIRVQGTWVPSPFPICPIKTERNYVKVVSSCTRYVTSILSARALK